MSEHVKVTWLTDHEQTKVAPKTLSSQVYNEDGTLFKDQVSSSVDELSDRIDHINEAIDSKANKTDVVQADWNQNDDTALDYIKNRTHWVEDDGETYHPLDEKFIPETVATKEYVEALYTKLNSNTVLGFYCVEDVTIVTNGISKTYPANSNVEISFIEDDVFEIIPTSDNSILTLTAFPSALGTYYPWLEGVRQFSNILFDMNAEDMYSKWSQGNQGAYQVQFAQYTNCIFWSDNPYISDVTRRTNYTLYYTTQLPLCYSTIPDNTFKSFYLAVGAISDPNWGNPAYRDSFAKATWATQAFSYYGARTVGLPGLDSSEFNIVLPKDCRGLMFDARNIEAAGIFDATNTTNFGAKSGSWREAFGDCTSLRRLYIKNLKVNLNISWSTIDYNSIYYIISESANTNKITISVSPYTYNLLDTSDFELAASKNITIELLATNYVEDKRLSVIDNIENGTTAVKEAEHAASADSATKAIQDASGNVIESTYETKADAQTKLDEAKAYADDIKNDLLNGAGDAYDTLKELGDLIDENVDAIDALEIVAAGKQNKITGLEKQTVIFDSTGNLIASDYVNEAKKLSDYEIKNVLNNSETEIPTSKIILDHLSVKADVKDLPIINNTSDGTINLTWNGEIGDNDSFTIGTWTYYKMSSMAPEYNSVTSGSTFRSNGMQNSNISESVNCYTIGDAIVVTTAGTCSKGGTEFEAPSTGIYFGRMSGWYTEEFEMDCDISYTSLFATDVNGTKHVIAIDENNLLSVTDSSNNSTVYMATTSYVNEKLNETVNPDWDELDPNSKAYILNKPFYEISEEKVIISNKQRTMSETSGTSTNSYYINYNNSIIDVSTYSFISEGQQCKLSYVLNDNSIVEITGNVKHYSVNSGYQYEYYVFGNQYLLNGLTNPSVAMNLGSDINSGENTAVIFAIAYYDGEILTPNCCIYVVTTDVGMQTTSLVLSVVDSDVVQLDEKFIPDTIARVSDIQIDSSAAGEKVTGREFEMLDGSTVVAAIGSEIFNDYENNKATGEYSHAEGNNTVATGDYSHAEGYETVASGAYGAHAEGDSTVASEDSAHAEGYWTEARGWASHAEGEEAIAIGYDAHAEGYASIAFGDMSHAEGVETFTGDNGAHAEGNYTAALYGHAEGYGGYTKIYLSNNADNRYIYTVNGIDDYEDIKIGNIIYCNEKATYISEIISPTQIKLSNGLVSYGDSLNNAEALMYYWGIATESGSHAEGMETSAIGDGSHSEGIGTIAYGSNSHAEGDCTIAGADTQHVQGKYNIPDVIPTSMPVMTEGTYAHIVGNGTNEENRSNAHTLDWQGNAWFAGDVYVGSTSGTNRDDGSQKLVTEAYVDSKIGNIPTPDVSGQIDTHNTSSLAHDDIRNAVSNAQSKADEAYNLADNHTHNSIKETNAGLEQKFWRGTQSQYDAIETKDASTMYIILDSEGNSVVSPGGSGGVSGGGGDMLSVIYDPQNRATDIFAYIDEQMILISTEDIDEICGVSIQSASEVEF